MFLKYLKHKVIQFIDKPWQFDELFSRKMAVLEKAT